jgi:hypothetical protein
MFTPLGLKKFTPKDLESLVFGQQHYGTQSFFTERFGQYHTIPLRSFPHFQFLDQFQDDPFANHPYMQYLKASWDYLKGPEKNTEEARRARIEEFLSLFTDVRKAGKSGR